MTNWEDALLASAEPEESTPIYDALYLEYRERFWVRLGFVPDKPNEADTLKKATGASSVTVVHERRNADGSLEVTSTEESN